MVKLIPHTKQGHGLMVFCNKCKKRQSANHCIHQDKWKYKTDFKIEGKRYAKVLQSNNYEDALQELFSIKSQIKNPKEPQIQLSRRDHTIIEGIEKYGQKIACVDEFQDNKPKSKNHQNECLRIVDRFGESLESLGVNLFSTPLNSLPVKITGVFSSYIKAKYNVRSQSSKDKHTRIMRHFFDFLKNADMYHKPNFFKLIETKPIESSSITVSDLEFKEVLKVICRDNGHTVARGGTRNQYYDWLKDALVIARFTGLRSKELFNLKWSDIKEYEDTHFLFVIDWKVTEIKGVDTYKAIPLEDELYQYLNEYVSRTDTYIIDTGYKFSTFKDNLSRAFTHFYKVAFPGQKIKNFKHLRKAHITELSSILGEEAYLASGHSGNRVIEQHYINQIEAATKFSKFKNQLRASLLN